MIKKIIKNAGFLLASDIFGKIFSFFFIIYTAQYLGSERFGALSFALAFTGLFALFIDMGLSRLMIREIARDRTLTEKYISNILIVKCLFSIATWIILATLINLLEYPRETIILVYIAGFFTICNSFSETIHSVFQAHEKMEYVSLGRIIYSTILFITGILAIIQKLNVYWFAIAYLISSATMFLCSYLIMAWKFGNPKINFDVKFTRILLMNGLPFALFVFFGVIYFQIDIIMLSLMGNDEMVGLYQAAVTLISVIVSIPNICSVALFPVMARSFVDMKDSLNVIIRTSMKFLTIVAIPIATMTYIYSDEIIVTLYKSDYLKSALALNVLIWIIILRFNSYILGDALSAINKQNHRAFTTAVCALVNITLNLFLIPSMGYIGASIATVITEVTLFGIYFYFVNYYLDAISLFQTIIKPLIAGIIMVYAVNLIDVVNQVLNVSFYMLGYISCLYIFNIITERDKQILRGISNTEKNI